jgi:hypothetical protein
VSVTVTPTVRAFAGIVALAASCLAFTAQTAAAADFTWTGSDAPENTTWSDTNNWAGHSAPSGTIGMLAFPALTSKRR